jgi:nucleotide-binding universal stress UspA family protein
MFKTILFPIDQSRDSREAAEKVAELVKLCGSRLSVEDDDDGSEKHLSGEVVDQLLESARSTFSEWGITSETIHRSGKVAFCICDVADEIGADLIAMGCHGIGLSEEHAHESVSSRVINLSPCPVLIVP